MKILILGAQGNLGSQLVKIFSEHDVIPWDRSEVDITDNDLVAKKIKQIKPDVVINAGAYNAVDKCESDDNEFEAAKKLNQEAPGNLARVCLETGSVLIHYSSDYVFGGHAHHHSKTIKEIKEQGGFMEDDEPRPVNRYGQTKLGGEQEIIKYSGKGLKWYLLRTSKLFGPKGASSAAKPSFFDIMLKLGAEKGEVDVVNDEISCFTYTPDLALATRKIIEEGRGYGIYHIVNQGSATWYKAVRSLYELSGMKVGVNPVASDKFPRPAKRPKYSVLKNTKLEPMRNYEDALKEYLSISK